MSTAAVLIPAEKSAASATAARYSLLLSTDAELIEAAQRLRYDVFSTEPGFALRAPDGRDHDEFDEFCDHILVRDDDSGALVGCYRMLPPPGAIAAGACTPQRNSTSAGSMRCGPRWSRWAARWCAPSIATARWC